MRPELILIAEEIEKIGTEIAYTDNEDQKKYLQQKLQQLESELEHLIQMA